MSKLTLFTYFVLALLFVGCDTADKEKSDIDYVEYNQKVINYLQKKYNVEADVRFSTNYKQRLTKEATESLEEYYKFIANLKEPIEMDRLVSSCTARIAAVGTKYFSQVVKYELDGITVGIYYDVDSNGEISDKHSLQAGLGGEGTSRNYSGGRYTVTNYKFDCSISGKKIIAEAIRGDYEVRFYNKTLLIPVGGINLVHT